MASTSSSPVVDLINVTDDHPNKSELSGCLKKYHPYFTLMRAGCGEVSDRDRSNMVRMKCNIKNCSNNNGKGISSSKISAANLVKHIRGQHRLVSDKILKDIESQSQCLQQKSSGSGPMERFLTFKPKTGEKEDITKSVVKLLTRGLLPLSLVEKQEFRDFCTDLNPRASVPCRATVVASIEVKFTFGFRLTFCFPFGPLIWPSVFHFCFIHVLF